MATVLFISEQTIKENTILDENVDATVLRQLILDAQEEKILPVLGTALYEDIKDRIDAGTLNAAYTTLLDDYISKALKYWVLADATDILTYKYRDKGVLRQHGEKTLVIDVSEVRRLVAKWENKAELHTDRLIRYVKENAVDSFPLYLTPGTGLDIEHPRADAWDAGIYLGKRSAGLSKADRYENNITE